MENTPLEVPMEPEIFDENPPKKKMKKGTLVIIIIAAVIVLCCCISAVVVIVGLIPTFNGNEFMEFGKVLPSLVV